MRLAYLSGIYPKASETFVYREVQGLRARGHEVAAFTLRPGEDVPGVGPAAGTVYPPGRRLWPRPTLDALLPGEPTGVGGRAKLMWQKAAGARLAGLMREAGVRHVHAHFAHAPASVAMYAARAIGGTFSFTGHANDLFQRRHVLRRKLERAAFVACISEWHRELYRDVHQHGTYEIVRAAVDAAKLAGLPEPADKPMGRRVLTLCRLVAKKGVDTLIEAVNGMNGWSLTVAGDGPEMQRLRGMAGGNVTFLGAVSQEALPGLLAGHDVFAMPCREDENGDRDGIPVALMEAMAGGLPVVTGDLPAVRELVADGRTGLLVPSGPPAAVAPAVRAALGRLEDDAERVRLAEAGRARAVAEFSLETNLTRLEACLANGAGVAGVR